MFRSVAANALALGIALWLVETCTYFCLFYILLAGPIAWALDGTWFPSGQGSAAQALFLTLVAETICIAMVLTRRTEWELWRTRLQVAVLSLTCLLAVTVVRSLPEAGLPSLAAVAPLGNVDLTVAWAALLLTLRLGHLHAAQTGFLARRVLVVGSGVEAARTIDAINGLPPGMFRAEAAAMLDFRAVPRQGRSRPWGVVLAEGRAPAPCPLVDAGLRHGVKIVDIADFWEAQLGRIEPNTAQRRALTRATMGSVTAEPLHRALDISVAALLLLLFAPLMALTALAIRIDSTGPVIYRQVRVGRHCRPFTLLKFRSMRLDSEVDGPIWAAENDSRVTRVGRIIRLMRIDELPQLLNVLAGTMSLVGPSTVRHHFTEPLSRAIPLYLERTRVKPGLTGWAQVNHPYGASIEDARVKHSYDLYYVKHRSILFDLAILFATVRVVLFRQGAR